MTGAKRVLGSVPNTLAHNAECAVLIAQTDSSTIYGLGLALTELISFKNGMVEQSNFTDYVVMRNRDVPLLHTELIKTDNHPTGAGKRSAARSTNNIVR